MDTINACPRGHRYRASILHPGRETTCPRCDRAELMALAYGDCQKPPRACRLLDFRTEAITSWDEGVALLEIVGSYNRFNPFVVGEQLRPIFPRLMSIEIGREGSPVIYASIPYWRHQEIRSNGLGPPERIAEDERKQLGDEFLKAMERAEADELSGSEWRHRAWWD
jgi:hypothetical protein